MGRNKVTIGVNKAWLDNTNLMNTRPINITARLFQTVGDVTPVEVDVVVLSDVNGWEADFEPQSVYNALGVAYVYTVAEDTVEAYEPSIVATDADSFIITNTLTGTTELTVTKIWGDDENEGDTRPESITIRLFQAIADGDAVEIEVVTISDSDGWVYTFTDMELYNEQGQPYLYSVTEDPVEGYTAFIDGLTIINSLDDDIPLAFPTPTPTAQPTVTPELTPTPEPTPEFIEIPDNIIPEAQPTQEPTPTPETIDSPDEPIPQTGQQATSRLIGLLLLGIAGGLHAYSRRKEKSRQ